eukprot:3338474-Rhodomonas_salina.2
MIFCVRDDLCFGHREPEGTRVKAHPFQCGKDSDDHRLVLLLQLAVLVVRAVHRQTLLVLQHVLVAIKEYVRALRLHIVVLRLNEATTPNSITDSDVPYMVVSGVLPSVQNDHEPLTRFEELPGLNGNLFQTVAGPQQRGLRRHLAVSIAHLHGQA